VATPKHEHRIAIECASKASRRLLYAAIRRNKGQIRCSMSLSPVEYKNKAEVYRSARKWRLQIQDRGDMMIIRNIDGTSLLQETTIWLGRPETHIAQEILKVSGN
jgi:hypothetical protein